MIFPVMVRTTCKQNIKYFVNVKYESLSIFISKF